MKRIIKFEDKVVVVSYNVASRLILRYEYSSSFPMNVCVRSGLAEEPLDMLNQSEKDLLSDVDYYTSLSQCHVSELKRPIFFGKNGRKLSAYWNLR